MNPTLQTRADRAAIKIVSGALEHFKNLGWAYLIEYRKAKAAEDLYQQLSRQSDAELARRGLHRKGLIQFVRERICGASDIGH